MKPLLRAATAAAAAATLLCAPALAAGALDAKLVVGTGTHGVAPVRLTVSVTPAATGPAPIGRIQIFVPAGYTPSGSGSPGTAEATVYLPDVVGSERMRGAISVRNPAEPAFAAVGPNCDNVAHVAAWAVTVAGATHDWTIPVFVDKTTGSEAQFGETKLVVCPPPSATSPNPGTTTNSSSGANGSTGSPNAQRLISLSLNLGAFRVPAATGEARWRALVTPFGANGATLTPSGSVEAQSLVALPQRLTLTVAKHGSRATLTGSLTAAGKPIGSTLVQLQVGKTNRRLSPFARVRTSGAGTFSKTFRIVGTRYFRAFVTTNDSDLGAGACTPSFGAAVPCVHAFSGGSQLLTNVVRVTR